MLDGLLIRSPFIELILKGSKTWEMRGSSTTKRGRIALIKSGTGTVVGVVDLVDVVGPLKRSELAANASKAGFPKHERITEMPLRANHQFAFFIVGHAAPEQTPREMIDWLRKNYPGVKIIALNPVQESIPIADYNVIQNGPEAWLRLVARSA